MKQKVTIDKLIASHQENAAPPPPDPDLMWADMAKRLDAATPSAGASDPSTATGPAPAAAAKQAMSIITWLILGLAGLGTLYAIASRQWAADREKVSQEMQADPASVGEHALLTELQAEASAYEGGSEMEAAMTPAPYTPQSTTGARALETRSDRNTSTRGSGAGGAAVPRTTGKGGSATGNAGTGPGRINAAGAWAGTSELPEMANALFSDINLPDSDAIGQGEVNFDEQRAFFSEEPLLSLPPALLDVPAPVVAWPPVEVSSARSLHARNGVILYAGSTLGKTPRVYQNYTPAISFLNLGVGYRMPLRRGWLFQPELWLLQFETPRLSVVTEQRLDLEGNRLLQYDTVSVMRMQGVGINLMMGAELPLGFTVLGGAHLGRYAGVMTETASGQRSLVNVGTSWSSTFSYAYDPAPDWFHVYQAGIKLGVEKRFGRRVILGLNMYQGLSDLYRDRESGRANLPNSWVIYAGYRL